MSATLKLTIGSALLCALATLSILGTATEPPGAIGPYLNGVFPDATPGFGGSWYLEEVLTEVEIAAPLEILELPDSDVLLVLCKTGKIWRVDPTTQEQRLVLDISDRTINYSEAGSVSFVLHPNFGSGQHPNDQFVFVFYRYKPRPRVEDHRGYNRLSKFRWNAAADAFEEASEEILIQQYDRSAWHNGGGLFFHDGLLYLAVGDEGEPDHREASNQRLDGGFFSGLLRIDVDNDPARSHPVRRQPLANEAPPDDWPQETFSQGYSIPNDNPWLAEDGSVLEEFFALGIRSPYSTHFDAETATIWLGDVGSSKREEINIVEKGDNLQWNFLEGEDWAGGRPDSVIGNEKPPLFHYGNDLGKCIIGGGVYRGDRFPYLTGKYIFGDYSNRNLMVLNQETDSTYAAEVLLSAWGPEPLELAQYSSISGVHPLSNGDILLTVIAYPWEEGGKILHLRQRDAVPDPPARLSELGVFADLRTLETNPGIFPYAVNAPLWSDRAEKRRWMAVPNDGTFDAPEEQIVFSDSSEWRFPPGTVFIKHFDLPDAAPDGEDVKLETRFFVIGNNRQAYGLTYRWNEAQTDAFLQREGAVADYEVQPAGQPAFNQRWGFPGRGQCMSCHTPNAGFVLGVKTHQLNGELFYPGSGQSVNQLAYLSEHGIIDHDYRAANAYPRARNLHDDAASLDEKIRSYLDANCASCHRAGGVTGVTMDLRFHTPLEASNIIDLPVLSHNSTIGNLIVRPGYHAESELWLRDQSTGEDRMPPIGRNLVDEAYVDALAAWIDGLGEEELEVQTKGFITFPNPSDGWMVVRANPGLALPLRLEVYGADGRLVHTERHEDHDFDLGLQRVGPGTYVLSIFDALGEVHHRRVVIR